MRLRSGSLKFSSWGERTCEALERRLRLADTLAPRLGNAGVVLIIALVLEFSLKETPGAEQQGKVDFLRDVRPILANHCFKCHGQDEAARKAKLRLDVRDVALKPTKSREAPIVPGKPDKSELVRRIFAEDDDQMPPAAAKRPLTQEQKEILKRWIAEGAEYKPHWAFIKPVQEPLPKVRDKAW